MISITPASLKLLTGFVNDAPNWSGSPMVDVTPAEKGNLTQLKKAGFLHTFRDEGIDWVVFNKGVHQFTVDGLPGARQLTVLESYRSDGESLKLGLAEG